MSRKSNVRSSEVTWDGMQGFVVHQSGLMTNAASIVMGHPFIPPCDMTIIAMRTRILTAYSHANSYFRFGTYADTEHDTHLSWDFEDIAAGDYDSYTLGTWVTKELAAGVPYVFATDAADTTGVSASYFVAVPKAI